MNNPSSGTIKHELTQQVRFVVQSVEQSSIEVAQDVRRTVSLTFGVKLSELLEEFDPVI